MLIALHLLVNIAGFNTHPSALTSSVNPAFPSSLSELLGNKNGRRGTVQSPTHQRSESESQAGSVAHQKVHTQEDGNG